MLKGHLKKLGSDSIVYGLGGIVNRLLSFLMVPLFTAYLKPEDYGIMAMLALVSMAMSGVYSLGTGNSMGIYYFETEVRKDRDNIIWTNALLLLVNVSVLSCICFILSPYISLLLLKSKEYSPLIILGLAGFALQNLTNPLVSYLRMERKPWQFFWLTLFSSLFAIGMNIYFIVVLGRGVRGMLEVSLISATLFLVILMVVVGRQVPFGIDLKWLPRLVKTGFPSVFGVGAFFLVDWSDRAFVQHYWGLDQLGIYSLGYSFGMVMILFAEGSFGSAWPPYFLSFINRRDEARHLFGKIFKYAVTGYGFLTVLFFIAARPVVTLMTTAPFHQAWLVVGMVACSYVMKVLYLIVLPPLCFEKKLHVQTSIEWIAAIVNLGLNFALVPSLGIVGAALATLVSYLLLPILTCWAAQKLMRVDYEWKSIGTVLSGTALLSALTFLDVSGSIWWDAAINIAVLVVCVFFSYRWLLDQDEQEYILSFLAKIGIGKTRSCVETL